MFNHIPFMLCLASMAITFTNLKEGQTIEKLVVGIEESSSSSFDIPKFSKDEHQERISERVTGGGGGESLRTTNHFRRLRKEDSPDDKLVFAQENLLEGEHLCGWDKCLFGLKADPTLGYVALGETHNASLAVTTMESLQEAYNLSNIISNQYNMRHVYVGPPQSVPVTADFRAWLNTNRTKDMRRRVVPEFNQDEILVQMVEIQPSDTSYIWGSNPMKLKVSWERIDDWLESTLLSNATEEREAVLRVFQEDVRKLHVLLEGQPCLWFDFQIFLLSTGNIVHLDLDRCYNTGSRRVFAGKIEKLRIRLSAWIDYVTEALQTGMIPTSVPQNDKEAADILTVQKDRKRRKKARLENIEKMKRFEMEMLAKVRARRFGTKTQKRATST